MSATARLRILFEHPGIIRLIGAHNALGAKIAAEVGFDGVWSSSLEISASYTLPDASILTMTEYLAQAKAMVRATSIPVIAVCDSGYGNVHNVIHMVREFEAAGVAAVCMEDKIFPKVNSFVPGFQKLAPLEEFASKIRAALDARHDPNFMIIARVEALIAGQGLDEALKRAHAYVAAGADAILIHSAAKTPEQIIEFFNAWDFSAPLIVVPTTYYTITAQELEAFGVKVVIYANHGIRTIVRALRETFSTILDAGTSAHIESEIVPMQQILALQGMPELKQNERLYANGRQPAPANQIETFS
jgi:phosphoenolpyruvate phosphomutase